MMLRVLIVDDEPWVAYGLANLIDWEALGFTVIGEAHDGLSAMAIINEQRPDVVLSDIRMPGLDGIELLETIMQNGLNTKVILVSGYAEFEYAQRAVRLGAFDYLLKQVDKEQLAETLRRLKAELLEQRAKNKEFDLLLDDLFDLLEPDRKIKIGNFLTNKGVSYDAPHFRFVTCTFPRAAIPAVESGATGDIGFQLVHFRTGPNKFSFLTNYDELKNPRFLLDFMTEFLRGADRIGISSLGVYSASLFNLYQESDIALFSSFCRPEERIIAYKSSEPGTELSKKILQLELAVKENKQEQIAGGLDELKAACTVGEMQIDQLAMIHNHLVSLVHKYYGSTDAANDIEYMGYYQLIRSYGSVEQLFERFGDILGQQAGEELHISNETVKKIINRIESGFTEDIQLGSLSRQFNLSIGYLSALIKKETGISFTEYVTSRRLALARTLLADAALSVHEIVERVGYKDYFHFNKLFKKHFGVTPSKFRKM